MRKTCRDPIAQEGHKPATGFCYWCEEPVPPSKPRKDGKGVKARRFCNDTCSRKWWNAQRPTGNPPGRPREPGKGKRYWTYGLLESDADEMLLAQEFKCAICKYAFNGDEKVDHCHQTETVRGFLCGLCNSGLGFFKDEPERLRAAANYLEKFK